MKKETLNYLKCPLCGGTDLSIKEDTVEKNEIKEGKIICSSCSKVYPIKDYIAIFDLDDKYSSNFGFEWNRFLDIKYKKEIVEFEIKNQINLSRQEIQNKTIIEIGSGSGQNLHYFIKEYKAKFAIGIELSSSVFTSKKRNLNIDNLDFIKADLFSLPIKENSFDIVFSNGVLHHTPNTYEAFKKIIPLVKKDGIVSIWVYGNYWSRKTKNLDFIREKITSKIPPKLLFYLSIIAAGFLYYIYRIPIIGDGLRNRLPIGMDKSFLERALSTFDMYSPKYAHRHFVDEVYNWFKENNFYDIEPSRYIVGFKGRKS